MIITTLCCKALCSGKKATAAAEHFSGNYVTVPIDVRPSDNPPSYEDVMHHWPENTMMSDILEAPGRYKRLK